MKGRRIALSLLPLALACLGPPPACSETWTKQFVDVGTSSGPSTSLGLIQGYPVISYFGASRKLKYAYLNPENKTWYLQTVDAGGEFTSLATDSLGIVHVGYINAVTMHLNYWRNNQGRVEIQLIDSESGQGGMGFYNSIQVDAQGRPRISYFRARSPDGSLSSDLKYAEVNGSTWTTEFVDTTGERGKYNSLALDGSGNPQIAYFDNAGTLRLAKRVGSTWTKSVVDSNDDSGRFNSIRLDALGDPRISYTAGLVRKLRYAFLDGVIWNREDVDDIGALLTFSVTSLALDRQGNPHISYYDATTRTLKYASRTGGTWTIQTVDSDGDVGAYSSLQLDAQDRPIISYFDATSVALKIAYGDYPDQDGDGIPDVFDFCPANPDCNSNGTVDGREGGIVAQAPGPPVGVSGNESIFGCGSLAAMGGPSSPGGAPPADLLFLLTPAAYLIARRRTRPSSTGPARFHLNAPSHRV